MNRKELIKVTEEFVRQKVLGFDSSHDWWHIDRVRKMALLINKQEAVADAFILEIASLLHDLADSKFSDGNPEKQYKVVRNFMDETGMMEIKDQVIEVLSNVSFSNQNPSGNLKDPVLLILQDSDRLDAIGAIGIARAFNYGGFMNRIIYIPVDQDEIRSQSTISHFYNKLLKLKDMMNTPTGRAIAEERHAFLDKYLEQFYKEWNFTG
jgi:uncharacterized protein